MWENMYSPIKKKKKSKRLAHPVISSSLKALLVSVQYLVNMTLFQVD